MLKFFLLFSFLFTPLFAEDESLELFGGAQSQNYNFWGEFFHMMMTLGFIIILILVSVWVLKKIMRGRVQTLNRSNGIKILERRPLNPKASLYLVDILGKGVVISESQSGIQVITEFSHDTNIKELYEEMLDQHSPSTGIKESLTSKLRKLTSKHAR